MSFSPDFLYAAATLGVVFFVLWVLWSLMWGTVPFTEKARRQKEAKIVLGAARTFILSYEDLPAYRDGGEFATRMGNLRDALSAKDVAECKSLLEFLDPPKSWAAGREWLDILVVSISVAMAFRAYFYEPFNIPTGSMRPTLYGNHSVACSPKQAGFFDVTPLKWFKWVLTGEMYECFCAPFAGYLEFTPTNTGHYDMRVVEYETIYNSKTQTTEFRKNPKTSEPIVKRKSNSMLVPTDARHPTETGDGPYRQQAYGGPNGLYPGAYVRAGQLLWSGFVVTGDFLFVNRWLWNFRHPRRGDVMIFSTTGVSPAKEIQLDEKKPKYKGQNGVYYNLQQGTHYIKRMTGTPGETLSIKAGHLVVDGKIPMEPLRIRQIQNREKWHEKEPAYAGYAPSGEPLQDQYTRSRTLAQEGDEVKLGPDEYFACGDNSPSSYDSRYWGPVPAANLRGIAGGVFWPIWNHRWGPIE